MGIITGLIIGILATRLVYVDVRYSEIVDKYREGIEEIEKQIMKTKQEDEQIMMFNYLSSYQKIKAGYRNRQENNRNHGTIIDILTIALIILFASLATLGIFDKNVNLLLLSLLSVTAVPVLHFLYHITFLRKAKSV